MSVERAPDGADGEAEVLLVGANGRRYDRAPAGPCTELDATLAGLGYRPLGDLAVLPLLASLRVRAYRTADGTAVAAVVLNGAKVASTTFLAPLEKDALVVTSDALVPAKVKRRLFATTLSGATPATLEAALREQRAARERKHGPPTVVPADLAAAAGVWEAWWVKREG